MVFDIPNMYQADNSTILFKLQDNCNKITLKTNGDRFSFDGTSLIDFSQAKEMTQIKNMNDGDINMAMLGNIQYTGKLHIEAKILSVNGTIKSETKEGGEIFLVGKQSL
jgi:hypothetical protein